MSDAIASHTPTQWYILRYIKPDTIRLKQPIAGTINQFNRTENTSLELFAPTIIRVVHREGKLIKVESPLAYQYIFLRGDIQPIRKLCCLNCGFSLVLNHGSSEKYARLTDEQMNMFRQIATAYRNRLPFFAINDIDLQQGDKVEILEGSFPGLIGYYIPKPKSASGNIVRHSKPRHHNLRRKSQICPCARIRKKLKAKLRPDRRLHPQTSEIAPRLRRRHSPHLQINQRTHHLLPTHGSSQARQPQTRSKTHGNISLRLYYTR